MRCRVRVKVRALRNCAFLIITRIRSNRPILFLTEKRFPGVSSLGKATADLPRTREAQSPCIAVVNEYRSLTRQHIVRVELLDGEVPSVGRTGCGVDGNDVG